MNGNVTEECLRNLEKYPVLFAYLFGSKAMGTSTPLSDTDIAVYCGEALSRQERFDLRLRLSSELSACMGGQVDVVVMNDTPLQLSYEIIKNGRVILCRDNDARVERERSILSRYLDRRYYDKRRAAMVLERVALGGGL
jgi:hypothetical protein